MADTRLLLAAGSLALSLCLGAFARDPSGDHASLALMTFAVAAFTRPRV